MTTEEEFEKWFSKNHPFDWYAKENGGEPMAGKDRLRVRYFAQEAYLAATQRTAQRCVEICEALKPVGGQAWSDSQYVSFGALDACAKTIRELFLP